MALKAAFGGARWQNFGKAKAAGAAAVTFHVIVTIHTSQLLTPCWAQMQSTTGCDSLSCSCVLGNTSHVADELFLLEHILVLTLAHQNPPFAAINRQHALTIYWILCAGPKTPAVEASAAAAFATSSTMKPEETGPAKAAPMTLAEKAAARPQPSRTPPPPAAAAQPGASRSLLPPSRLAPEGQIVGLKDLIAVMEHHPIYCKSDHLYQLYDRLDHP